jgi:hypothetical protein
VNVWYDEDKKVPKSTQNSGTFQNKTVTIELERETFDVKTVVTKKRNLLSNVVRRSRYN